jgi:hypothetical protein
MTARGGIVATGASQVNVSAIVDAIGNGVFDGKSALSAFVNFGETDVEILGEDWSIIEEDGEVWSVTAEGDETWTLVAEGSESWSTVASDNETWSVVSEGNGDWNRQ